MDNEKTMCLKEYVAQTELPTHRKWVEQYLLGKTYDEIAKAEGCSPTKIWLIVSVILKKHPPLREDSYREVFEKYQFNARTFFALSGEDPTVYRYLKTVCTKGTADISQIAQDETLPRLWREKMMKQKKPAPHHTANTVSPARHHPKNLRVYKRVVRRIEKQFDKKFYIGDIVVSDEEYGEILTYAQAQIQQMEHSQCPLGDDPIFAVALVQIGIRRYDGNFWTNAGAELGTTFSGPLQGFAGKTFINTLKAHNKFLVSENERVKAILFHTFVSDYYSKGLFEFLFQYYVRDLERDIYRNDKEQMQALMDTIDVSSSQGEKGSDALTQKFAGKGSRAYKLRDHTLSAISANPAHSRMRLRRLLRLIDRAFWKEEVPAHPTSRLTILFKEWCGESPSFSREHTLYKQGEIRNRGKKHFSFPYLFADIRNAKFSVKLPEQIIREEYGENVCWSIATNSGTSLIPTEPYPVMTGLKTELCAAAISDQELFGSIDCRLLCGETLLKHFSIPAGRVRFFDMEGDYASRLFRIPMCAFAEAGDRVHSAALLDTISFGNIKRWDFDFMEGDVVVLPDSSSMVVGERYSDGYVPRGRVPWARYYREDGEEYAVYSKPPELLLTIPSKKINGTMLDVNGTYYSLGNCQYTAFDNKDAKGVRAFILPLSQFPECRDRAVNQIILDVPGGNYDKEYSFVLVKGFSAEFDGAPYIFEDRAAVTFPDDLTVKCIVEGVEKIPKENGYQFSINNTLGRLNVLIGQEKFPICMDIPVVLWSRDAEHWEFAEMGELWHTDFPEVLYFKAPSSKLYLEAEFDSGDDDDDETHCVKAEPYKKDIYKVDLTRFRSWFTRDRIMHRVNLKLEKQVKEFAQVYVKSFVVSCEITADFEREQIVCVADIVGKADYSIDVTNLTTGQRIAEKAPMQNGKITLPDPLLNGQYAIEIFESEEDDSGFDDSEYYSIHRAKQTLVNKENISGQYMELRKIKPTGSSILTQFSDKYWITDIQKESRGTYTGRLLVNGKDSGLQLQICFPNPEELRYFHITFWDNEEECYVEFIYDTQMRRLLETEAEGLSYKEKYRRYRMVYEEDYVCFGILYDTLGDVMPSEDALRSGSLYATWQTQQANHRITIEELGLSIRTRNCLQKAGIQFVDQIQKYTWEQYSRIRSMGNKSIEEIQEALKRLQ